MDKSYEELSHNLLSQEQFSRLNLKKDWYSLIVILIIWISIFSLILVSEKINYTFIKIISLFIIAGLQHHLATFIHEGAHNSIHSNKNINNLITYIFCSVPLYCNFNLYKHFHLTHHRFTSDPEKDPEFLIYKKFGFKHQDMKSRDFIILFFKDYFLINTILTFVFFAKYNKVNNIPKYSNNEKLTLLAIHLSYIALISFFNAWQGFIIYWLIPSFLILPILLRYHSYAEHIKNSELGQLSSINKKSNLVWNFFFYPIRSYNHLEHHLYMTVPWYNLNSAKELLNQDKKYRIISDNNTIDSFFFKEKSFIKLLKLSQ